MYSCLQAVENDSTYKSVIRHLASPQDYVRPAWLVLYYAHIHMMHVVPSRTKCTAASLCIGNKIVVCCFTSSFKSMMTMTPVLALDRTKLSCYNLHTVYFSVIFSPPPPQFPLHCFLNLAGYVQRRITLTQLPHRPFLVDHHRLSFPLPTRLSSVYLALPPTSLLSRDHLNALKLRHEHSICPLCLLYKCPSPITPFPLLHALSHVRILLHTSQTTTLFTLADCYYHVEVTFQSYVLFQYSIVCLDLMNTYLVYHSPPPFVKLFLTSI